MTLQSKHELDATQKKLRELEQLHLATATAATDNAYARDLTLRSLRRTINQLKEEIARFEARTGSTATDE